MARWSKILAAGAPVCVTVTLLDGLVLARSTFKHSMNYRSVVIFGRAIAINDFTPKRYGLERIVEHLVPGRSRDARPPTEQELAATSVLHLDLSESSAKIRAGGPLDDDDDRKLAVWAGALPARLILGPPLPDELSPPTVGVPDYLTAMCSR